MHGGTVPSELLAGTGLAVTGALHHWLLVPPVAAHPPLVHLARLTGVHGEVVPPAPQLTVDRAAHTPLPLLHPVLPHHPQPAPPVPRLHAHRDRGASRAGWAGRHAGVADPPPALPDLPARPRWAWGARGQAPQAHQVGPVSLSNGPVDDPVLAAFEEEVVVAGDGVALPVHQRTVLHPALHHLVLTQPAPVPACSGLSPAVQLYHRWWRRRRRWRWRRRWRRCGCCCCGWQWCGRRRARALGPAVAPVVGPGLPGRLGDAPGAAAARLAPVVPLAPVVEGEDAGGATGGRLGGGEALEGAGGSWRRCLLLGLWWIQTGKPFFYKPGFKVFVAAVRPLVSRSAPSVAHQTLLVTLASSPSMFFVEVMPHSNGVTNLMSKGDA